MKDLFECAAVSENCDLYLDSEIGGAVGFRSALPDRKLALLSTGPGGERRSSAMDGSAEKRGRKGKEQGNFPSPFVNFRHDYVISVQKKSAPPIPADPNVYTLRKDEMLYSLRGLALFTNKR